MAYFGWAFAPRIQIQRACLIRRSGACPGPYSNATRWPNRDSAVGYPNDQQVDQLTNPGEQNSNSEVAFEVAVSLPGLPMPLMTRFGDVSGLLVAIPYPNR